MLVSAVRVTVHAEVRRCGAARIVGLPGVLGVHLGSRVVAVVTTNAIGVLAANR